METKLLMPFACSHTSLFVISHVHGPGVLKSPILLYSTIPIIPMLYRLTHQIIILYWPSFVLCTTLFP
jgi:hypothetical protein